MTSSLLEAFQVEDVSTDLPVNSIITFKKGSARAPLLGCVYLVRQKSFQKRAQSSDAFTAIILRKRVEVLLRSDQ